MQKKPKYTGAVAGLSVILAAGVLPAVPVVRPAAALAAADAKPEDPFRKGAFYGQVVDAATGKPVAGATVAVLNQDGKAVAWARTDAEGRYALAAEALKVLRLEGRRTKGFFEKVAGGVGQVVTLPVKVVGVAADAAVDVVKQIDPLGAVKAAAASAVTGTPAPLAGQIGKTVTRAATDQAQQKIESADTVAEKAARESIARSISGKSVSGGRAAAPTKDERKGALPGEALIAVSAPGYQELRGKAGFYWLADEKRDDAGRAVLMGPQAWLETAKIAPAGADPKKVAAAVSDMDVKLSDPVISSTLIPSGEPVALAVRVNAPAGMDLPVRVFAREKGRGSVAELKRGENGVYAGELKIDPKTGAGPTEIAVAALRSDPVQVNVGNEKAPDPLLEFARGVEGLRADKDFAYDARIFAASNRIDVPVTILDPRRGAPPGAFVPAGAQAVPAPAAPAPAPAPAANPPTPEAPKPAPPG